MLDAINSDESINILHWLAKHTVLYLTATSTNMGSFFFLTKKSQEKKACVGFNPLFRNDH